MEDVKGWLVKIEVGEDVVAGEQTSGACLVRPKQKDEEIAPAAKGSQGDGQEQNGSASES